MFLTSLALSPYYSSTLSKPAARRHKDWPKKRREHLVKFPYCAACRSIFYLEVHHVLPYHLFKELELDPDNLITLCEGPGVGHHLWYGHNGNYRLYNPNVREDTAEALAKFQQSLKEGTL